MSNFEEIGSGLIDNDGVVRMAAFASLFAVFAVAEALYPRRRKEGSVPIRWYSNIAMSFVNSFALRFVFPVLGLGMAVLCAENGWGLFNDFSVPYGVAFVGSLIWLDFVVYLHHVMFHKVPWLWRLHRVHHADVALDVTSGVRFHVLEAIVSMAIKLGAIVLIGPPVMAVLLFEIVLNGASMFNHANIRIPLKVDRVLRWFLVTPDMHRVHHSIVPREMNSNYGFNIPIWDRLFGTYTDQPAAGHEEMTIGLSDRFRSDGDQHLHSQLIQPFRSGPKNGEETTAEPNNTQDASALRTDQGVRIR